MKEIAFDTLSGTMLGNFYLTRMIGHSQTGPIFLARFNIGSETYLLRFLADSMPENEKWHDYNLNRFHSLARQLTALQHTNILPLLDYGLFQDIPYIVMPNLPIRSLRSRLVDNGPVNIFTVGRYLDQITAALEYAHNHGVLHGNLTLDTIFIRLNGQVVVTDFGVRSLVELLSGESRVSDNMELAPEQRTNGPVGTCTDVYALGAALYELLFGKPVFADTAPNNDASKYSSPAIQPYSTSRSDLPAGLVSIISRALAKDPKQRYQQAGVLANAYHEIVDSNNRNRVPFVITSSPTMQARQQYIPETTQTETRFMEREWIINSIAVSDRAYNMQSQEPQTPFPPVPEVEISAEEDLSDSPTLKRVRALPKQTYFLDIPGELKDHTTAKRIPAFPKQTPFPGTLEELSDKSTNMNSSALHELVELPIASGVDILEADSTALPGNSQVAFSPQIQRKNTSRLGMIGLLLLFIMGGIAGVMLISKQTAILSGFTKHVTFLNNTELLLGLCIALAVGFTVSFNIISRLSLATTRHEYAYTILWQMFCALLAPLFLLFDRFTISFNPQVLPLFVLSIVLWALVDAFLFSAFKYEEVSILSAIFPLNFLFTFVVSVIFFHSAIRPTIVVGFLVVMFASLLVGLYHTRFKPSKGIIFGLLYSFFLGVALGLNSEVVKSFSIAPYMFAAFLFPALANLFIFLRPKRVELRYELKLQWKKILLNAAVMDASFFFLLKAFQLGNVPQVVALTASSTLITALAGVVLLKEDKHITLKTLAAVLATVGLILVQR
ncbi:MAG: protein kinase domain-containing protein [Ktedonobacteraceae bacterium]